MQDHFGRHRQERKRARVRRMRARQCEMPRAASAAVLFGICAMVLASNAIWWKTERGYPMGMSLFDTLPVPGRASAGAATPNAGDDEAGPMLSLDIDITAEPGPEVASSRWTSVQSGVIELYARDGASSGSSGRAGYRLLDCVEAGPVVELSCATLAQQPEAGPSAALPGRPMWAMLLVAGAEYDQSVGAMSKSRVTTAYAWDGHNLAEVWSATTRSEAVWNLAWDAPPDTESRGTQAGVGAPDWIRLTSVSRFDFVAGSQAGSQARSWPSIVLRSSQKHESYNDSTDVFTTIKSRDVAQTYYWSDKWSAFILYEAMVGRGGAAGMEHPGAVSRFSIPPGTVLAVLESEGQCAEGLVFDPPHLLRVKMPDGRRCFVDEGSVAPTPSRAMV